MIEKALRYIVGMKAPVIQKIDSQTYSDKELYRIAYSPKAEELTMSTLCSLVDYIRSGTDSMAEKMLIQVQDPETVILTSMLDEDRERETLAVARAEIPFFNYKTYMGHEEFLIALQSKFLPGEDRNLLLKFAGTVENGTVAGYGDDGISQKATIRTGVASKSDAIVPNPVRLRPFRTFLEVEQPESSFIFRMKESGNGGVQCAIFEADGGAWRIEAMRNMKEYLERELKEVKGLTIIS